MAIIMNPFLTKLVRSKWLIIGPHTRLITEYNQGIYDHDFATLFSSVDGGYSPFTNWSDCTETCGGGEQIRTRTCTNPPPQHFGKDCSKDGPDYEKRKCNTQECPGKPWSLYKLNGTE